MQFAYWNILTPYYWVEYVTRYKCIDINYRRKQCRNDNQVMSMCFRLKYQFGAPVSEYNPIVGGLFTGNWQVLDAPLFYDYIFLNIDFFELDVIDAKTWGKTIVRDHHYKVITRCHVSIIKNISIATYFRGIKPKNSSSVVWSLLLCNMLTDTLTFSKFLGSDLLRFQRFCLLT